MNWLKKPLGGSEVQVLGKKEVESSVRMIIENVRQHGDNALIDLTSRYDHVIMERVKIDKNEVKAAYDQVDSSTIEMVESAAKNIKYFAEQQLSTLKPLRCEKTPGVILGHKLIPVESVGCYVPAGRYPLPSSALMSIIPAKVAGVQRVAACAPPSSEYGSVHPLVLVAMDIAGADEFYSMGGAQAIAAYCYGTVTIAPVAMIVGPGNKYVVEAKRQLNGEVGIDLLAGPSEVLIIADQSADPHKVAVDLIAKCEHDPDAVSILITIDECFGQNVLSLVDKELKKIKTREVASASWENYGEIIVTEDIDEAIGVANDRAPEHLQIMIANDESIVDRLTNYGSLFIGEYSPVAFGDYCSGTNHTLPTNRCARFSNGLWAGSFIKVLSYQKVTVEGARNLSVICSHLAAREGLFAHQASSDLRK